MSGSEGKLHAHQSNRVHRIIPKPRKLPRCSVRFADFSWCDTAAHWIRGEQPLCTFHAGMCAGGILPRGINEDGKWA